MSNENIGHLREDLYRILFRVEDHMNIVCNWISIVSYDK